MDKILNGKTRFKGIGPFGDDSLNEEIGNHLEIIEDNDGILWQQLPENNDDVIYLGFAPKPNNSFQLFIHHLAHGLLMRYNLVNVLLFSIRNSRYKTSLFNNKKK